MEIVSLILTGIALLIAVLGAVPREERAADPLQKPLHTSDHAILSDRDTPR